MVEGIKEKLESLNLPGAKKLLISLLGRGEIPKEIHEDPGGNKKKC